MIVNDTPPVSRYPLQARLRAVLGKDGVPRWTAEEIDAAKARAKVRFEAMHPKAGQDGSEGA